MSKIGRPLSSRNFDADRRDGFWTRYSYIFSINVVFTDITIWISSRVLFIQKPFSYVMFAFFFHTLVSLDETQRGPTDLISNFLNQDLPGNWKTIYKFHVILEIFLCWNNLSHCVQVVKIQDSKISYLIITVKMEAEYA